MILETRDLKYTYPDGTEAVKGVDMKIEEGKKIALVGPNGSGKSTLFLLLNGTLEPTSGQVLFHGHPLQYGSRSLREVRKSVGIVFQNSDDQLFAPTVRQDVAFGPTNLGMPKDVIERDVDRVLEHVGISDLRDRPPHHMSGGQKKRAAIAGVMAMRPEVMILDEPTSNLDPVGAEEIMDLLDELSDSGTTIIISVHDVDLAYKWSDYVYLLAGGKVTGQEKPEELFKDGALLNGSKLRQPVLMEVYDEIAKRGLALKERPPKSISDLVNVLIPPELKWMNVPPGTREGKIIISGLEPESEPEEFRVLHLHDGGRAIVETTHQAVGAGCIFVCDTDRCGDEDVKRLIEARKIDVVGVMGTKSRDFADKYEVPIDIASNVIDKTILRSICGSRCLILTNGGMVAHAKKRVEDYSRECGIEIEVSVIDGKSSPEVVTAARISDGVRV